MFQVTTLDLIISQGMKTDHSITPKTFSANHQLNCKWTVGRRAWSIGLGEIYTFGPTFRAEKF